MDITAQLSQLIQSGDYAGAFKLASDNGQLALLTDPSSLAKIAGNSIPESQYGAFIQAFAPYEGKLTGSPDSAAHADAGIGKVDWSKPDDLSQRTQNAIAESNAMRQALTTYGQKPTLTPIQAAQAGDDTKANASKPTHQINGVSGIGANVPDLASIFGEVKGNSTFDNAEPALIAASLFAAGVAGGAFAGADAGAGAGAGTGVAGVTDASLATDTGSLLASNTADASLGGAASTDIGTGLADVTVAAPATTGGVVGAGGGLTGGDLATAAGIAGGTGIAATSGGGSSGGTAPGNLPDVTVTPGGTPPGATPPGGGPTPGDFGQIALGGAGALAGGGSSPSGTGGSGNGFLSATSPTDIGSLSPDLAQSLGIDTSGSTLSDPAIGFNGSFGGDGSLVDPMFSEDPGMLASMNDAGTGFGSGGLGDWFSNPKNLSTLGLLGLSGANALSKPKLPGFANDAGGAAEANLAAAEKVIGGGGAASPNWAGQKASIDASIDQQLKDQSAALQQAAVNSGMGNQNSGVVQQQIATLKQKLEGQRQALYEQAQAQNVQQAIQELTSSNSVLMGLANLQLQQQEQARAAAGQTAELALLLAGGAWSGKQQPRGLTHA